MPRIANIPTSDSSSEDEEENKNDPRASLNRQSCYRASAQNEKQNNSASVNFSQNSRVSVNGEEDPYCLRRVIDGKVTKFKKDTRTWLHKSSNKTKRKSEDVMDFFDQYYRLPEKVTRLYEQEDSNESMNLMDARYGGIIRSRSENFDYGTNCRDSYFGRPEWVNVFPSGNDKYRENPGYEDMCVDDDFLYIGDSDADLTYSEETSPVKSRSYVDNWRHTDHRPTPLSSVNNDNKTEEDNSQTSGHSLATSGSSRDDSSFEHLDLCNESGNSIRNIETNMEISRKMAPAIAIERESYMESLLDYAVNQFYTHRTEEVNRNCDGTFRKTRTRVSPKFKEVVKSSRNARHNGVKKTSAPGPARYHLRSDNNRQSTAQIRSRDSPASHITDMPMTMVENISKPSKYQISKDQDLQHPNSTQKVPRCNSHLPSIWGNVTVQSPGCSWKNLSGKRFVPSLFALAAYVLHSMFKPNLEKE